MRVLVVIVAALALAAPASAATAHGVMTNGGGPVHSGEQGAIWQSRFVEHRRPGRWVVRFFELGHKLSAWRFTVRPEGD